jgi:hypothetical protein
VELNTPIQLLICVNAYGAPSEHGSAGE